MDTERKMDEERGGGGQAPSASDGTPAGPSGVHTPQAFKLKLVFLALKLEEGR